MDLFLKSERGENNVPPSCVPYVFPHWLIWPKIKCNKPFVEVFVHLHISRNKCENINVVYLGTTDSVRGDCRRVCLTLGVCVCVYDCVCEFRECV